MKKTFVSLSILSCLISCSKSPQESYIDFDWRAPASLSGKNKLFDQLDKIDETLNADIGPGQCHDRIEYYWDKLYDLDAKKIKIDSLSDVELDQYIKKSFQTRLLIKEKMLAFKVESEIEKKCLVSIKRAFMALRYVEDYLIEFLYQRHSGPNPYLEANNYITLTGRGGHFLVNEKFNFKNYEDLEGGDVILSRGNAYSSAAIARIGKTDTQFSHLSLIHKDKSGKLHTSEAHIEIGNVVAPLKIHLDQKNARSVVFRHRDRKLSHMAGKIAYDHTKKAQDSGKNIEYDFAMDYKDSDRLFCSEVIYYGYKEASKKLNIQTDDIPLYKTTFEPTLLSFLESIGVGVTKDNINTFDTFGPGDIQFDKQFEIVAEWRNPEKLRDSRFKDAILTKLFEWMEKENYGFFPSTGTRLSNQFGYFSRRSDFMMSAIKFFGGSDLSKKFPLNMKKRQMDLFVTLDKVGEYLYSELDKEEKKAGHPLAMKELFVKLDSLKEADYKIWRESKRPQHYSQVRVPKKSAKFHQYFHPK